MTNAQAQNRIRRELMAQYPAIKPITGEAQPAPEDPAAYTLAMRVIEAHFGRPLKELLNTGEKGVKLAEQLKVSPSTIAHWRRRLGLTRPYNERIKNGHDYG